MWQLERNTDRRTAFISAILARVFRDRRKRVSFLLIMIRPLLLLGFFQGDHFVRVTDTLCPWGSGAIGTDFGSNQADNLFRHP